jgi:hypothetical protein
MKTEPRHRIRLRITPEDDNRLLEEIYMTRIQQKAFAFAAVWLFLAVLTSATMIQVFHEGNPAQGCILAIVSILLWHRVCWNVKTCWMFRK